MTDRGSDISHSLADNFLSTLRIVQLLTSSIAIMNASPNTALAKATMPDTQNDVCDDLDIGMAGTILSSHVQQQLRPS